MQWEESEVAEPMRSDIIRARSTKQLSWMLFLAPFAVGASGSQIPKAWGEFVSLKGGYIAYFPKSWHVLTPGLPTLEISSFPPSRAVRAVVVPDNGGATISIAPPPAGITNVEQWIANGVSKVRSRDSLILHRTDSNGSLHISEVVYESIEGPDTVSWYFEISGRLLVANLSYWRGDRNAQKYRQVLREMIEVIVPLPR